MTYRGFMRLAIAATTLIALCGCSGNTSDSDKIDNDGIEDAVVENNEKLQLGVSLFEQKIGFTIALGYKSSRGNSS